MVVQLVQRMKLCSKLAKKGYKVGMVRLITIWPFADKVIADLADKVDAIFSPRT